MLNLGGKCLYLFLKYLMPTLHLPSHSLFFTSHLGCYHTAQCSSCYSFLRNNLLGQTVPVDYTQVGCCKFFLFKLDNCSSESHVFVLFPDWVT